MTVNDFINSLVSHGWNVKLKDKPSFHSNVVQDRFGWLPDSYKEFLSKVAYCVNPDNDIWFLCDDDFEGKSDWAFAWNDFELQSLESALEDEELIVQIKEFWNTHISILFSVKDCYEYLAISLKKNGAVVHGEEPIYEDVSKVCDSFDALMEEIIQILNIKKTFSLLELIKKSLG